MHPRQAALFTAAADLLEKTSAKKPVALGAPVLWKYVDPDSNQEFFLPVRKMTVRSPYTGKSFTTKPEKLTVPAVGKEMKEMAAPAGAPGPKAGGRGKRADWETGE